MKENSFKIFQYNKIFLLPPTFSQIWGADNIEEKLKIFKIGID